MKIAAALLLLAARPAAAGTPAAMCLGPDLTGTSDYNGGASWLDAPEMTCDEVVAWLVPQVAIDYDALADPDQDACGSMDMMSSIYLSMIGSSCCANIESTSCYVEYEAMCKGAEADLESTWNPEAQLAECQCVCADEYQVGNPSCDTGMGSWKDNSICVGCEDNCGYGDAWGPLEQLLEPECLEVHGYPNTNVCQVMATSIASYGYFPEDMDDVTECDDFYTNTFMQHMAGCCGPTYQATCWETPAAPECPTDGCATYYMEVIAPLEQSGGSGSGSGSGSSGSGGASTCVAEDCNYDCEAFLDKECGQYCDKSDRDASKDYCKCELDPCKSGCGDFLEGSYSYGCDDRDDDYSAAAAPSCALAAAALAAAVL